MMRFRLPFCLFLLAVIAGQLVSCTRIRAGNHVAATLDSVESYINDRPDSALAVLRSVDTTALHTRALRARYSLLRVMALDKCFEDITRPGLLDPAVNWYERHGSADERMKALYYQGRIAQERKDQNGAAVFFSRAEEFANNVTDKHALGVLYLSEAVVYGTVHNIGKQKEYTEKGLTLFEEIDDPMKELAQGQLAVSLFALREWEKADSLFRKGLDAPFSNPQAESVFLSNYAQMKVLKPTPDPEGALALLDRKRKESGQGLSLREAGIYAYALTLSGREKDAQGIVDQLEKRAMSSPMEVEPWLGRCALASGDYKRAYESLYRARLSEDSVIQASLSDSVSEAISAYNAQAVRQKQMQYRFNMAIMAIILLLLTLALVLAALRRRKLESERSRILDVCSALQAEAAEQETVTARLQEQLAQFREIARQERVQRFRQAGKLRASLWRLDHLGLQEESHADNSTMTEIKKELSYVYDIDGTGEDLIRRLDQELGGVLVSLLEALHVQDKPQEQLFLGCCLLDIPADVVAARFKTTPNNVRVKKSRLRGQIAKLNNPDYDVLFAIRR